MAEKNSELGRIKLNSSEINSGYNEHGYFVIRDYFNADEISSLRKVILKFHQGWKDDNATFYQQEAFNSSLITGSKYLAIDDRMQLFNFISSKQYHYHIKNIFLIFF